MTKKNAYKAAWSCPSNIALIKYWGKKPGQLPLNPSLSFGLQNARTKTSVSIQKSSNPEIRFLFEGKESSFGDRIEDYLNSLQMDHKWIRDFSFLIKSENSFPHSAGIASSASSFGALALCLTDLTWQIEEKPDDSEVFFQHASRLARLGSGSACRSIYQGFSIWGRNSEIPGSTDGSAIPINGERHSQFKYLRDAVLLVDSGKKKVSSSEGHRLMNNHPFKENRVAQANNNLNQMLMAIKSGDLKLFFELIENEALSLHALMMSSEPSFVLLKPESLLIIEKIRSFRKQTGIPVGFTIDAGPNIHLLYFGEHVAKVHSFIHDELQGFLEDGEWLDDRVGEGPVKLE